MWVSWDEMTAKGDSKTQGHSGRVLWWGDECTKSYRDRADDISTTHSTHAHNLLVQSGTHFSGLLHGARRVHGEEGMQMRVSPDVRAGCSHQLTGFDLAPPHTESALDKRLAHDDDGIGSLVRLDRLL